MKREAGFNLLELLIGLTIVSILVVGFLEGFGLNFTDSTIRSVANDVQAGIQHAKFEAIKRSSPVLFRLSGTGWTIELVGNPSNTILLTRVSQKNEMNVWIVPSPLTITFNNAGFVSPANSYTINITNPTSGGCVKAGGSVRCLNVTVNAGGQVKMCDPALPSTDPRGC